MSLRSIFKRPGSAVSHRQKTGWIGIDIGTGSIKFAQVQRTAGRLRLARSLIIRAEDNHPFDLQSFSNGRIGDEIRSALKLNGVFRGRETACVVSMNHCQLRTLVIAKGSEDEQRELISLEIENVKHEPQQPQEPQEFEFWDGSPGEQHENRGMPQVHVLSMPRTLSDAVANNLLQAKLQCQVLDAVPFAAVRASEMAPSYSTASIADSTYTILDWGYSVATLMVVHQGQPLITRTLKHCGMQRILHGVCQQLKLSGVEAEAMLTNYGVAATVRPTGRQTELQSLITSLCGSVTRDLVEEIQETLSFIKMQFPEQVPGYVCLMGGGAAIRNMDQRLQHEIRLPVHNWTLRGSTAESVSPVLATAASLSALAWEL